MTSAVPILGEQTFTGKIAFVTGAGWQIRSTLADAYLFVQSGVGAKPWPLEASPGATILIMRFSG